MPDGVMLWFDPAAGEGVVVRGGRRYPVRSGDVEPDARAPGARVHFDVARHDGVRRAVAVTLREGTRVSHRQGRFGDLAGAARPDAAGTAPFPGARAELADDLQRRPVLVVERWVRHLGRGDLDEAMLLVAPDAALHAGGASLVGTDRIRGWLASWPVPGSGEPELRAGEDGSVALRWAGADRTSVECIVRVAHGLVTDLRVATVSQAEPAGPVRALELSTAGPLSDEDRERAMTKLEVALAHVGAPVLSASVRLELAADPSRDRPALARAVVDVDGDVVRAHVTGHTVDEAVDLLEARLRDRLGHVASHRRALRRRGPSSPLGEWRHGDRPTPRDRFLPLPVEEREIVRRKTFTTREATVDEAAFDLESMDEDFLLFTELGTGLDALLTRTGDGGYSLRFSGGPPPDEPPPAVVALVVDPEPAPALALAQAREHLDATEEPWVFFTDTSTGRGHVLYRRLDGNYGLLHPVDEPDQGAAGTLD